MNPQKLSEKLYEHLVNDEDARACKSIPESACHVVPGNFVITLISVLLTKMGDALLNPKITLPWLLHSLGAPAWMLGWLVPIRESGSMLPQLAIASAVRRFERRKWFWVLGSSLQALSVLGIAVVSFYLSGQQAGIAILTLLIIFSLSRGLCSIAFKDVVGKTIPKHRRGSLAGWSSSSAGLITVILALCLIFTDFKQGNVAVYATCFTIAAGLWFVAAALYSNIQEQPGETQGGSNGLLNAIKRLSLIKTDPHFRHFVMTRSLLLCSALSAPFIVVLAQHDQQACFILLALFMAASGLASLISGPFWGRFANTSSRSVMIVAGMLTAAVGISIWAITLWIPSVLNASWVLPLLYFILSIAHQGVRLGRKTYIVNMAEGNQRTDYVSVSNTLIGAILLLTGFISSLEPVIGVNGIIFILSVMGLCGSLMALSLPEVEKD